MQLGRATNSQKCCLDEQHAEQAGNHQKDDDRANHAAFQLSHPFHALNGSSELGLCVVRSVGGVINLEKRGGGRNTFTCT